MTEQSPTRGHGLSAWYSAQGPVVLGSWNVTRLGVFTPGSKCVQQLETRPSLRPPALRPGHHPQRRRVLNTPYCLPSAPRPLGGLMGQDPSPAQEDSTRG